MCSGTRQQVQKNPHADETIRVPEFYEKPRTGEGDLPKVSGT